MNTEQRLQQIHAANELGLTRRAAARNIRMSYEKFCHFISYRGIEWNNDARSASPQPDNNKFLEAPDRFNGNCRVAGSLFDFHPLDERPFK